MAVRIRLTRIGKKDKPFYRIGAYDSRSPRDGRSLEYLGWYNPLVEKSEDQLKVNIERTQHWLSVGALPSEKTAILLKRAGIVLHKPKKKSKKNKDKPKTKTSHKKAKKAKAGKK